MYTYKHRPRECAYTYRMQMHSYRGCLQNARTNHRSKFPTTKRGNEFTTAVFEVQPKNVSTSTCRCFTCEHIKASTENEETLQKRIFYARQTIRNCGGTIERIRQSIIGLVQTYLYKGIHKYTYIHTHIHTYTYIHNTKVCIHPTKRFVVFLSL